MSVRTWILGLLFLAAAAAGWWSLFTTDDRVRVGDWAEGAAEPEAEGTGATLAAAMGGVRSSEEALRRGGAVAVLVRRDGNPVAARVEAWRVSERAPGVPSGWSDEGAADAIPGLAALSEGPVATARTGPEGRARVGGQLKPGSYALVAVADDGAQGSANVDVECEGAVGYAQIDVRSGPETLAGKVVHADGKPFVGRVAAVAGDQNDSWPCLRWVTLDADGRFRLTGLPRGGVYLSALAPDAVRVTGQRITLPHPGEYVLVVDAGAKEVPGRVVSDAAGKPIPGAVVTASSWNGEGSVDHVAVRTVADAEGRFRVAIVPGSFTLSVRAEGFSPYDRWSETPPEELVVRLTPPGRVFGRVTAREGGAPVPGVAVLAARLSDPWSAGGRAVTDVNGRYDILDAPSGETMVVALGKGWATAGLKDAAGDADGWNPFAVDVPPAGSAEVNLVVEKSATANGRVLEAAGAPVEGALVSPVFVGDDEQPLARLSWLVETLGVATGADGRFAVDALPPGCDVRFDAQAAGFAPARAGPFRAAAGTGLSPEIRLVAPRWLEATVLERDSRRPVAGASVRASFPDGPGATTIRSATTNAEGVARVGPVPPGELSASASAPAHMQADWVPVGGPEGNAVNAAATLLLSPAFAISGRVARPDGSPAEGLCVSLEDPATGNGRGARVESDGSFSFDGLSPGTYDVVLHEAETWQEVARRSVPAGAIDVVFRTAAGGKPEEKKTLVVKVVGPDGAPVPSATVAYVGGAWENDSGTTEATDGRAEFQDWSYEGWLEASVPKSASGVPLPYGPALLGPIAKDAREATLRMPAERRIEGVVTGEDGRGVRGVRVWAAVASRPDAIANLESQHGSARTDEAGRFKIGCLGDGEYRVSVTVPEGYVPVEPKPVVAGATDVAIVLARGRIAAPHVVDARGRPVAHAWVSAQSVVERDGERSVERGAISDAAGVARLVGLVDGLRWRLEVRPPEDRLDLRYVQVEDWRPSDDAVVVTAALVVTGVVRDPRGRPVPGAHVTAAREGNDQGSVKTRSDGTFSLGGLEEGEVVLRASLSGQEAGESPPVTAVAGAENVTLVLDVGVDLAVAIAGWPADENGVWGWLYVSGGRERAARVLSDGALTFRGVAASGSYSVYVRLEREGEPPRIVWGADLRAGGEPARLALTTGLAVTGTVKVPAGAGEVSVSVGGEGFWANGTVDAEGKFTILALPPGKCRVYASAPFGDQEWSANVESEAGGTAELTLAPAATR